MPSLLDPYPEDDKPASGGGLLGTSVPSLVQDMNQLALGPMYVPRDPTAIGAGAGLSLERVGAWEGAGDTQKHSYYVKGPAGEYVGSVDTTYNPQTRDLRIEDARMDEGAGSVGPAGVIGLREQLRTLYPDAQTLSGRRISGANPDREAVQGFR